MDPRQQRQLGTSRVIGLHEDDGAFDREFWRNTTADQRLEAVWDLTLEYLAWTAPHGGEPRLQRSVCHIEWRER